MQRGLVSIIIPHYNGIPILSDCLTSLLKSTYKHKEIVVVDNGSTDGSVAFVRKHFPSVRILQSSTNLGYAGGCMYGLAKTQGELVVFLNNDTTVHKQWLEPLVAAAKKSTVAICQPKILSLRKPASFEYAGAAGGYMDIYGYPFCRGRVFATVEQDQGQYDTSVPIFWASGTCLFAKRSVLEKIGGFDASFFMYYEEEDLCWRAHLQAYHVMFVHQSKIYHYGEKTASRYRFKKYYYFHRNHTFFLLKNYSLPLLLRVLPFKFFLDLVMIPYFILHGHFKRAAALSLSLLWPLFHIPTLLRHRHATQSLRKVPDNAILQYLYPKSLAVSYFLLRKRYFTDYSSSLEIFRN